MGRRPLVLAVFLALVLASACGDGASRSAAPGAAGPVSPALLVSAQAEPRQVVYTGDLVVRVASLRKATGDATRVATAEHGFVFSQATDQDGTTLTVKVPSDRFDATVAAMAKLGKELSRNLKAQDVTADVVDVEGRLRTAQASADRLRALLAEARTPADVVAIEGELTKRETEIETLQGRLRVLNDQVALATLTVRLTERNDLKVTTDLPGFLGGLRTGAIALVNTGQALLVVLGFLLPFLPFALLAVWALRRYRRRHPRAPRAGPPAWVPPPPAAPPAEN
ncbi:MAG TPA: DUF4349 domain-containing protein [Acidimicrobiales bacterium]|nr:DUF4349 domain-containing protein [Acidimicrobiales bacterium]